MEMIKKTLGLFPGRGKRGYNREIYSVIMLFLFAFTHSCFNQPSISINDTEIFPCMSLCLVFVVTFKFSVVLKRLCFIWEKSSQMQKQRLAPKLAFSVFKFSSPTNNIESYHVREWTYLREGNEFMWEIR